MKWYGLLACCVVALWVAGAKAEEPAAPDRGGSQVTLAVIPKGTTHVFWKSVEAGALAAGKEFNAKIIWKGPLKENDRAQQIAIVEQFVSEGVDGLVLAPLDDTALRRPVKAAMDKKIPVVIIDSALKGQAPKDFVATCSTNNFEGGVMGGKRLAELLQGKGKVVLLRYLEGSASTMEREAGFLDVMKKNPGITVLVDNRYGGATSGDSKTTALDLLDKLKEADGIFCSNEPTTLGMLLALRQNGLAGKVKFVGFDSSDPLIKGLQNREIDALVAQNPFKIGYEGVKTMVAHIQGKPVAAVVDTGVELLTRENLETPAIRKLLGKE